MEYTFRKCRDEDAAFIMEIKERCFRWYIEKIYGWDYEEQLRFTRREMAARLQYMNIIRCEEKDIGMFTFFIDEAGDACIGMFAILPEYQGKGLGTQILKDAFAKYPGRRFYLQTYRENPARRLYQRVGFEKYGETDTHWLMEKKIHVHYVEIF